MRAWIVLTLALLPACAGVAAARPAHKQALAQYFGPLLPKALHDCRTCHLAEAAAAGEDERPHNAFGQRLKRLREEWRAAGKKAPIDARLDAVLQEDADGDGVSNLVEILTGHQPGDKNDRPSGSDLAKSTVLVTEFTRLRKSYPWRPFETVQRPRMPTVKNSAWSWNPIDAFVVAEQEANGLVARPEAPREVLLRRVYLDLIGLPPTPAELHAFLDDRDPDAFAKVVERLLSSPLYGERWGRHWMDVWRYSDWAGYGPQVRDSQPHIWRWRDWIIDALNADKGYDRMILEMLAGDELAPEDPQALAATGYLVRNYKLLSREKWLQDTVEHTFMAFQGVTLQCCKCHDHMYDPLLQREYYQVRAIFEPHNVRIDRLPLEADAKVARVYDRVPAEKTYLFRRGDDRTPDTSKPIEPGVPDTLGGHFRVEPVRLRRSSVLQGLIADAEQSLRGHERVVLAAAHAGWRSFLAAGPAAPLIAGVQTQLDALQQATALAREAAEARLRSVRGLADVERIEDAGQEYTARWQQAAEALVAYERRQRFLQAHLIVFRLRHGLGAPDPKVKLTPAQRLVAAEKELAKTQAELMLPASSDYTPLPGETYPRLSTGRRLALAGWLTAPDNPLTARVAVNHIWLRHFGQALVPSVFDFGRNGRPPSHPALLDWLAVEFMERGWKMKDLHRLIVTSRTYCLASTPEPTAARIDPDNKYLWRYPPHRLEAEAVRDSLFHVAGQLDLKRGGPDIDHSLGLTVPRRSLYFRHAAEKQMEFLLLFDAASVTECYERRHSIVPQQALALLNNEVALKHAALLARSLPSNDERAFTTAAFERVLSRPPTAAELGECVSFLQARTSLARPDSAQRARESLVHALMNHHDFVTIR
jgi:hypothetical protein